MANQNKDLRAKREIDHPLSDFSISELSRILSLFYERVYIAADSTLDKDDLFNDRIQTISYRLRKHQKKSDNPVLTLGEDNLYIRRLVDDYASSCKIAMRDSLRETVKNMPKTNDIFNILFPVIEHVVESAIPRRDAVGFYGSFAFYWRLIENIESERFAVGLKEVCDVLNQKEGLMSVIRSSYADEIQFLQFFIPEHYFCHFQLADIKKSAWSMVKPSLNKYARAHLNANAQIFRVNFNGLLDKFNEILQKKMIDNQLARVARFKRMAELIFI